MFYKCIFLKWVLFEKIKEKQRFAVVFRWFFVALHSQYISYEEKDQFPKLFVNPRALPYKSRSPSRIVPQKRPTAMQQNRNLAGITIPLRAGRYKMRRFAL